MVESVLTSVVAPPAEGGRLLVASNGAYGERIATTAKRAGIANKVLRFEENEAVNPQALSEELQLAEYSHLAVIHHETTAGVLNPIAEIG